MDNSTASMNNARGQWNSPAVALQGREVFTTNPFKQFQVATHHTAATGLVGRMKP